MLNINSYKGGVEMQKIIQTILEWIEVTDKKALIGITGHGAAGKTTFTERVLKSLDADTVNILNTDPYIITSGARKFAHIEYEFSGKNHTYTMTACHPAAHNISALERDIQMIRDGMDLQTIEAPYQKSTLLSAGKNLTIVEGMSAAFVDPGLFDLSIYLYTDGKTEFDRRRQRDISERGRSLENLVHSHEERRIQYELFMHPYSKCFDVVINNSTDEMIIEKNLLSSI